MQNLPLFISKLKKELFLKFYHKIFSKNFTIDKDEYYSWLKKEASDLETLCKKINPELWIEAETFQEKIILKKKEMCKKELNKEFICRAGTEFLYFITRLKKPRIILETGVGVGFSSLAFLSAIEKNNLGFLYSSDLPYVKYKNSSKIIGYVVDKVFFKNWRLYTNGDSTNLKLILNEISHIDIFHYDSDKTYLGTKNTYNAVKSFLNEDSVIVFDDLKDHTFFYDIIKTNMIKNWGIYSYKGNYIGFIGRLTI